MTPNEVIVAALSEAGYPPDRQDHRGATWWMPLPPLDMIEKARDIAYPNTEVVRIIADDWSAVAEFGVDFEKVSLRCS